MNKLLPPFLALSCLLAAAPLVAQTAAPPAAASAASAPVFSVRPEVGTGLNQAIDLFRAGKAAEAKARIEQLRAGITALQPAEATVLARVHGLLSLQLEQLADAVKSFEAALAINAQNAQDQLQCEEALARTQFNLKAYPAAAEWARKAQAHGSKTSAMLSIEVRAVYLQNDYDGTIKLLEAQEQRAGKLAVDELRLLASSYGHTKDEVKYVRSVERLLGEHGRSEYWPDALTRVQRQPGWQPRWDIDLFRLRMQLDQMDEGNDFLVLADMAARVGLPAEAQKVMDVGYAKGMLGKGSGAAEQAKLRASVTKQAGDDRASLGATGARDPAVTDARSATSAFNTGAALVSVGLFDRGLVWMKAALAGPMADPAQGRLQYGVALAQAGRAAEAAEALGAVAGHEGLGLLARLWAIALAPKKP